MFWTVGRCGRDEVLRVIVLLSSRECNIPMDHVMDAFKQSNMSKRVIEVGGHGNTRVRAFGER